MRTEEGQEKVVWKTVSEWFKVMGMFTTSFLMVGFQICVLGKLHQTNTFMLWLIAYQSHPNKASKMSSICQYNFCFVCAYICSCEHTYVLGGQD